MHEFEDVIELSMDISDDIDSACELEDVALVD